MSRSPHGLRGLKFIYLMKIFLLLQGRSPHGLRGLKLLGCGVYLGSVGVAARMGCVD